MEGLQNFPRYSGVVFTNAKLECSGYAKVDADGGLNSGDSGVGCRGEGDGHPGLEWKVRSALGNGISGTAEEGAKGIGAEVTGDGLEARITVSRGYGVGSFGCGYCSSVVAEHVP